MHPIILLNSTTSSLSSMKRRLLRSVGWTSTTYRLRTLPTLKATKMKTVSLPTHLVLKIRAGTTTTHYRLGASTPTSTDSWGRMALLRRISRASLLCHQRKDRMASHSLQSTLTATTWYHRLQIVTSNWWSRAQTVKTRCKRCRALWSQAARQETRLSRQAQLHAPRPPRPWPHQTSIVLPSDISF